MNTTSPDGEAFVTAVVQFAILGHTLQRSVRAEDGRVTFTASRWSQSRTFSHWNDVRAFLVQVGGAR